MPGVLDADLKFVEVAVTGLLFLKRQAEHPLVSRPVRKGIVRRMQHDEARAAADRAFEIRLRLLPPGRSVIIYEKQIVAGERLLVRQGVLGPKRQVDGEPARFFEQRLAIRGRPLPVMIVLAAQKQSPYKLHKYTPQSGNR